ncbi:hypothetical protein BV25DRAFT_1992643 [Artomyces pyxidatus]|uniref:Uncharacterized protein n=1 Tax=Artomyces pyxidatus TaxID=48021 RepID=A0ACB8SXD4_9AGAM|nr:hypothetical protein BV25DRAFT_1992643 [Artomyces pyxidatus]
MQSEKRQIIDEQIQAATDPGRLLILRSSRNALAPVSRLPEAILTTIFLLLRRNSTFVHDLDDLTWLHVTHVCRSWRQAALDCALLWTDILFDPPDWAAEMLRRSKSAPLSVDISLEPHAAVSKLDAACLALTRVSHIRTLHLELAASDYTERIIHLLRTQSADVLEHLSIQCSDDTWQRDPEEIVQSRGICELPVDIFGKVAPRLQRLELRLCQVSWNNFLFDNLTFLSLEIVPSSSRSSMPQFLDFLRRMKGLKNLHITDAIPLRGPFVKTLPPPIAEQPLVVLPHLSTLYVYECALECGDLMRYMVLPRVTRVVLVGTHRWSRPASLPCSAIPFTDAIPSLHSKRMQEYPYHPARLFVRQHFPSLGQRFTCLPVATTSQAGDVSFITELRWDSDRTHDSDDVLSQCTARLILASPLDRIQSVTFLSYFFMDSQAWILVLEHLAEVQELHLTGACVYGFAQALRTLHTPSRDNIPLPKLSTLTISNAQLSYPLGSGQLFVALRDALLSRALSYGLSIKLAFTKCHITAGQLEELEAACIHPIECNGEPDTFGIGEIQDDGSDFEESDEGGEDTHADIGDETDGSDA